VGAQPAVIPQPSYIPTALTALGVLVLAVIAVVVAFRPWSRYQVVIGWTLPAALTTVVQSLQLHGTPFYLNGTGGDQFFRMQYLQRLASTPRLVDGNYVDLAPYYPAGWFWLGGRFADLRGIAPWLAYKPFAIATIAVASSLAFVLWSLLVHRRYVLLLAVVTAVAGVWVDPYEPYAWAIMAAIPPVAVLAWRLFGAAVWCERTTQAGGATVIVGAFLGVAGAVYTLMFWLFALLLVLLAGASVLAARWPIWFGSPGGLGMAHSLWHYVGAALRRLVSVGLVASPIVLLVWTPYLSAVLHKPSAGNAAARYLPDVGASLATPMLDFSLSGALAMLGLGWIILAWRRSSTAQALGTVVVACYLWQLLSTLALAVHTTLLSFNAVRPLTLSLWCAAIFGTIDLLEWLSTQTRIESVAGLRVVASLIAVFGIVQLAETIPDTVAPLRETAYTTYDDHGHTAANPDAAPSRTALGSWNGQVIEAIRSLSGRAPQDNVLVTSNYQLMAFRPYWSYQASIQGYANPLAQYPARNKQIRTWAAASKPQELLDRLSNGPFVPPNVFLFTRQDDGFHLTLSADDFPRTDNNTYSEVVFSPALFNSPRFRRMDVGPLTVIAQL